MNDIAIRVEDLSKRYRIGAKEEMYDTFAGAVTSFVRSPFRNWQRLRRLTTFSSNNHGEEPDTLWALRNVSFEVKQGEVIGIIGRNGAGKSTLLKILSRITQPTGGRVELQGRVSSLLEVGTGFHPELTGRENIYMNGTILGMTKAEIDRKFDEIVDFSGVEKFIDTPIKFYSSGMGVRLAFSVAAHLEPEILLIDEVLAVGDIEFQEKCIGKMGEVAKLGRTVLFVSHNMGAISELCQVGILFYQGQVASQGKVSHIVAEYLDTLGARHINLESEGVNAATPIRLSYVAAKDKLNNEKATFQTGETVKVYIGYEAKKPLSGVNFAISLTRNGTDILTSFDTDCSPHYHVYDVGFYEYHISLPTEILKAGRYTVSISIGINRQVIENLKDIINFSLLEISENTSFKGYSEQRPGILRLPLSWERRIVHEKDN